MQREEHDLRVPGLSAQHASRLFVAGLCSLAAGAVHAAAAGAHGDHRTAAVVFTALAAAQAVWGGAAMLRHDRAVADVGVGLAVVALGGWLLAKTVGVPVPGLEVPEPVQTADAVAAGLALAAGVLAALRLSSRTGRHLPVWPAVAAVTAVAALGAATASSHDHATGEHPGPHGDSRDVVEVVPVPYDPDLPIDLGGTPGVTPAQQAEAENLVAVTLTRLPQWSNPAVAEAAGFRSIGDGATGHEHLVNRAFLDDGALFDPDLPEALVYDTTGGARRLVAAMYMLAPGTPLDEAPDLGGDLVQWHTHEDLCASPEGSLQGSTDAAGNCPAGRVELAMTPMVHVWIEPHPCGPFAALEGLAGGRIPDGETRLCDHAHGSR
jgi:hypothetical protein